MVVLVIHSNSDWKLHVRLVLVVNYLEIVDAVPVNVGVFGVDHQARRFVVVPLASDHFAHGVNVVQVDVGIAKGEHQAARL